MYVNNFSEASTSLWYGIICYETFIKTQEGSSCLFFYIMTSPSGPQEHWGCMCLHLVGPGLKSEATKAASFSVDIFRGRQRPKCWDWHVIESLTKPRRLCSSAQSQEEQAFPLAMSHKVSLRKAQVEICFYQPSRSIPLLKYALFLVVGQRRHGEWARDEATQGKVKEHPGWDELLKPRKVTLFLGLQAAASARGDQRGGGKELGPQTTGLPSRNQGSSLNLALCLLSRTETPLPPNTAASPQCQLWAAHGLV